MPLTGAQIRQLRDAILSAYSADDLRMLTQFDLDVALDAVVPANVPLSTVAFDLIRWAEQNGRTRDLIEAVVRDRPNNPQVAALPAALGFGGAGPAVAAGAGGLDGPRRGRIRAVLLDQFPKKVDLAILLDDTLSQRLDEVAGGATLTEITFELVQWLGVDPGGRLRPFLAAATALRPGSAELVALRRELFGE